VEEPDNIDTVEEPVNIDTYLLILIIEELLI
jgi:hypothetical protein